MNIYFLTVGKEPNALNQSKWKPLPYFEIFSKGNFVYKCDH